MSSHPSITAAVADQHRRDLIREADAYRLARAARRGRPDRSRRPAGPALTTKRVIGAAAACTAAAALMLSPAGPAHASAHNNWNVPTAPAAQSHHIFIRYGSADHNSWT